MIELGQKVLHFGVEHLGEFDVFKNLVSLLLQGLVSFLSQVRLFIMAGYKFLGGCPEFLNALAQALLEFLSVL